MRREQTIEAIYAVLHDHLQHPHLKAFGPGARLNEDLYLDSVLMLQVFLNLELEFGLTAPDGLVASDDISTVDDLAALFDADRVPAASVVPESAPDSEGVHGEEYVDIKVHCFVSCVCAALKRVRIDHRPFYFGVWDADFAVDGRGTLLYHAPSISHDFFRAWYRRLYGATVREWYDHTATKLDNVRMLLDLVENKSPTEFVMVMLDMYHLPERENKFNQNPFPHYLMLETTEDPAIWQVLDPDFRWEGRIDKDKIVNAVMQPTVAGGYIFDSAALRTPAAADLRDYFIACFCNDNRLTDSIRGIVKLHVDGTQDLASLGAALREVPVISIRKYAFEHGFAFFWRALKLPDAEFQTWCEDIDTLAQGFRGVHYAALKLSETRDRALAAGIFVDLDRLDALERRIKARLSEVFHLWCRAEGLPVTESQKRRALA
jgi:acyl carrier protein